MFVAIIVSICEFHVCKILFSAFDYYLVKFSMIHEYEMFLNILKIDIRVIFKGISHGCMILHSVIQSDI